MKKTITQTLTIAFTALSISLAYSPDIRAEAAKNHDTLGIRVQERLASKGKSQSKKRKKNGVVVKHLRAYGVARAMGVIDKDIILNINNTRITNQVSYQRATKALTREDSLEILVLRNRTLCTLRNETMTRERVKRSRVPACAQTDLSWRTVELKEGLAVNNK